MLFLKSLIGPIVIHFAVSRRPRTARLDPLREEPQLMIGVQHANPTVGVQDLVFWRGFSADSQVLQIASVYLNPFI
jgi:hypothetical protein